jgi:DmsE family decaheme c-type cytochrome
MCAIPEALMSRSDHDGIGTLVGLCTGVAVLVALAAAPLAGQAGVPGGNETAARGDYVGWEVCQGCHLVLVTAWKATKMGKIMLGAPRNDLEAHACETCHGAARDHIAKGDKAKIFSFKTKSPASSGEKNSRCLQCHEKGARASWAGSIHDTRGVACTDCHAMMHNGSERANLARETVLETCGRCHPQRKAQQERYSHMPIGQGKMECTSCHNPHGSPNEKLLIATSVNETCYTCHTEKRGPFLWEHAPVPESCANCHDPHGSNHEKLLKVPRPRLCQQCHASSGHPIVSRNPALPADVQFVFNRQCQNCHFNIHGSNHPSGAFFTR